MSMFWAEKEGEKMSSQGTDEKDNSGLSALQYSIIIESWIYWKEIIICDAMSNHDQLENTNY